MESLTSLIEQAKSRPPVLDFEYFKAWPMDGWNLWLEFEGGDGMQVQKAVFMALLSNFWKENF